MTFSASGSTCSEYGVALSGGRRVSHNASPPTGEDESPSATSVSALPQVPRSAFLPVKTSEFPVEFSTLAHESFEGWCFANSVKHTSSSRHSLRHVRLVDAVSTADIESGAWWCPVEEWQGDEPVTLFHSSRLPNISLSLLGRVALQHVMGTMADLEMQVAALVLARRYCDMARVELTAHAMHRLYAACLYVAVAAHQDFSVKSRDFAHAAGLSAAELSRLIREVLFGIQWHAQVTSDDILNLPLN